TSSVRRRQTSFGECQQIVIRSVEISQSQKPRVSRNHLLRLHSSSTHGIEKKHGPQSVLRQQRFDFRQDLAAVDGRERMREAVDFHHCDIVIAQQRHHPFDESWNEQWYVATGYIGDLDTAGKSA